MEEISFKLWRCQYSVGVLRLDDNETHGEKAWGELHKNATCNSEKILEAASHKTAANMTTYLPSHKPSKPMSVDQQERTY